MQNITSNIADEVNALQDVILGKTRMIDAVSKEREEVVKALKEKKNIEEKLRRSGNTSMLRISELEEELANTKKLVRTVYDVLRLIPFCSFGFLNYRTVLVEVNQCCKHMRSKLKIDSESADYKN